MQRIRLQFSRSSALRYTGHLDMQTVWERTFRRARLPLAYSQGFHPQPRINQACPLPLGLTSHQEFLDFWLDPDLSLEEIILRLKPALTPGIEIIRMELIDLRAPALQTQVQSAVFQATLLIPFDGADLQKKVEQLLIASNILRVRRDKQYDLRALILDLQVLQTAQANLPHLLMHLAAREGATGRPEEVMLALDLDPLDTRFERMSLHFLP